MRNKDNKFWRSLGQLEDSPDYRKQLLKEHRTDNSDDPSQFSRRGFLSIMGASIALAGLAGCRRPVEKIVPYVKQSEEVIPGVPQFYATTMPLGNSAYGMVVESHENRPTKIEGNPKHPSSLGASNLFMQASILGLYDPDHSGDVRYKGEVKKLDDFKEFWKEQREKFTKNEGAGLMILSEAYSSPTMERLKKEFQKQFPVAFWETYEPINDNNSLSAIQNLTGKRLRPLYHYDKADVILSLDSDFLQTESESLTAAHGFAKGRKLSSLNDKMNRLYVVESGYSITGAAADHRLKLKSNRIGSFLLALAEQLKERGANITFPATEHKNKFDAIWLSAIADDLIKAKGKSLIMTGQNQPLHVHEQVLIINNALGNLNETISFVEDESSIFPHDIIIDELQSAGTIVVIGGNPAYNTPNYVEFQKLLEGTPNTIHLSEYYDETSQLCDWHIPRAHFLESWGDARAVDGTLSIIQPMIAPLFDGISDIEFLDIINTGENKSGYELVQSTWKEILEGNFDSSWRRVLHDGVLANSKSKPVKAKIDISRVPESLKLRVDKNLAEIEIVFHPSLVYDGRFSNNGWLQELPDPITKLVWDNAALISVGTAGEYNLENGDVVKIGFAGNEIAIPVWIVPGIADNSIHLSLGYGRQKVGRIANNVGFNVYPLTGWGGFVTGDNIVFEKTGAKHEFANTQDHNRLEDRPIYRQASLEEYKKSPEFAREMVEHPPLKSIYPDYDYSKGYQWGMVIDLNTCIGCGICTLACQSENNIPIVGKTQVGNGREMHWIRNDRYFTGDEENPEVAIMPVACQHCENAPCEQVCPVAATTHDEEGINNMTYNRCIGTRYCSNNCPYKVRKFNFFNYTKELPEITKMAQNPDVTVRSRGVMEKCTFCLQRIKRAKRIAKKQGRKVNDGDFQAACQQACPTGAIKFGNINDAKSIVATQKKIDRNYELLAELNVRPRNSYLARVRNINEELKPTATKKETH